MPRTSRPDTDVAREIGLVRVGGVNRVAVGEGARHGGIVQVEPGETREVSVTLDPNATSRPLSYWDVTTSGWQRAGGDYRVYVGASSRDIHLTGTLHIHDAEEKDSGKQAN